MKILLGKEQFISSEQFEKMEAERLRKEFIKENLQELAIMLIGGIIGAFAIVGLCVFLGV